MTYFAATIGRDPGRVGGVGLGVNIRQFFGSSSLQSSCRNIVDYKERMTEKITKKGKEEFMRQFENYGICLPLDPPPELEPFLPPTGKINLFSISYELNKWYLIK